MTPTPFHNNVRTDIHDVPYSHDHAVFVDEHGDGWTTLDGVQEAEGGHKHAIRGWRVQPAAGHTHTTPYDLATKPSTAPTALKDPVPVKEPDL